MPPQALRLRPCWENYAKSGLTSVIIILHSKGAQTPCVSLRVPATAAPRGFIRSSPSLPGELNPAINCARGKYISADREREEYEEFVCWKYEFSNDRGGFARAVRAVWTNF